MKIANYKRIFAVTNIALFIFLGSFGPIFVEAGGGTPTVNYRSYQWRNNDGDESSSGATFAQNANTPHTNLVKGAVIRLRVELDNTGTGSTGNTDYTGLIVTTNSNCTGGVLVPRTATVETFEFIESQLADNISTTDHGAHQSSTANFTAGKQVEDPAGTGNRNINLANDSNTYMEYAIAATSNASDGATYYFYPNGTLNNIVVCAQVTLETPTTDPPTVQTDAASSVSATSATLNGQVTATGGDPADTCGFAWGTNSGLANGDTATTSDSTCPASTGSFNKALSSLVPGLTYYFRAYAINTAGTGLGSIENFTTDTIPAAAVGRPRTLLLGTFLLLSGTLIIF